MPADVSDRARMMTGFCKRRTSGLSCMGCATRGISLRSGCMNEGSPACRLDRESLAVNVESHVKKSHKASQGYITSRTCSFQDARILVGG
jgi:hypothetical protein